MANPDKKILEFVREHLPYEIDMLRSTYLTLYQGGVDWAIRNALIESFCIHARNLLEFFSKKADSGAAVEDQDLVTVGANFNAGSVPTEVHVFFLGSGR